MSRKYRNYTTQDIINYVPKVFSLSELLRKLDLKPTGGNYNNMRRKLQQLNIDCSHWTGQGWNKGQQLKDWKLYKNNNHLKKHLIKSRTHCCESCNNSIWLNKLIPLELHHIDGNRTNNNELNLQLLCPNCHSLTKNFRNKKQSGNDGSRTHT